MSGLELHKELLRRKRKPKALFVSGYSADVMERHGLQAADDGPSLLLKKPFTTDDLLFRIRAILGARRVARRIKR
jgi:DNA-binding response OmpR family regulator